MNIEEDAVHILSDLNTAVSDLSGLIIAIQGLREHADGCRLQGGDDQLGKAMQLYHTGGAILRKDELGLYRSECWHRQETYKFTLGIGLVYAGLKIYGEAEDHVLHAILMFNQLSSSFMQQQECDISEALDMVSSLVTNVYFAALDTISDATTRAADGNNWSYKAWHVLRWCISTTAAPDMGQYLATNELSLSLDNMPVSDQAVRDLYSVVCSNDFLRRYVHYSVSMWQGVPDILDLLSQVLVRLDKRALAVQMYQQVLDAVDEEFLYTEPEQLALFAPIRLGGIRRVLQYCEDQYRETKGATLLPSRALGVGMSSVVTVLLDYSLSHLQLLEEQSSDRRVAALWGDVFRLQGEQASMSLALCVYAACFSSHGMGINSEMHRLAEKILEIVSIEEVVFLQSLDSIPTCFLICTPYNIYTICR
ncbi:hypothetical protein EON65_36600 [archaeon]|nr:MAG: hypothetical protein EON65_36600 [archaeon]